jgi:hypothetical protein
MDPDETRQGSGESIGRRVLRRIPDTIIVVCIVAGALAIGVGYRWTGVFVLSIAMVVGWKRDWCLESWEDLGSSSRASAVNERQEFAERVGAGEAAAEADES